MWLPFPPQVIQRENGLKSLQPSTDMPHSWALSFSLFLCFSSSISPVQNLHWSHFKMHMPTSPHAQQLVMSACMFGDMLSPNSFSAASPTGVPGSLFNFEVYKNWHTPLHSLKHHCSIYTPSKEPQKHLALYGQALQATYQHWSPGEGLYHKQAPTSSTLGVCSMLWLHWISFWPEKRTLSSVLL